MNYEQLSKSFGLAFVIVLFVTLIVITLFITEIVGFSTICDGNGCNPGQILINGRTAFHFSETSGFIFTTSIMTLFLMVPILGLISLVLYLVHKFKRKYNQDF